MKYILCEVQDYEDLLRYVIEVDDVNLDKALEFLKKDGSFGEVIMYSDHKPESYDKQIIFKDWVGKRYKELNKEFVKYQKQWEKTKELTQKDLDKKYEEELKSQDLFEKNMQKTFYGTATVAMPFVFRENIEQRKKEVKNDLRESKSLLEIIKNI